MRYSTPAPQTPPTTCAPMYGSSRLAGNRPPVQSPIETAGLKWPPEIGPNAYAPLTTVRPNASDTPSSPMPTSGKAAASTALPQPPRTNQNVPSASAVSLGNTRNLLALCGVETTLAVWAPVQNAYRFEVQGLMALTAKSPQFRGQCATLRGPVSRPPQRLRNTVSVRRLRASSGFALCCAVPGVGRDILVGYGSLDRPLFRAETSSRGSDMARTPLTTVLILFFVAFHNAPIDHLFAQVRGTAGHDHLTEVACVDVPPGE